MYQKEKLFTNIKSMSNTVILFDPIRFSCNKYEWVGASYFLNHYKRHVMNFMTFLTISTFFLWSVAFGYQVKFSFVYSIRRNYLVSGVSDVSCICQLDWIFVWKSQKHALIVLVPFGKAYCSLIILWLFSIFALTCWLVIESSGTGVCPGFN